jgi:hypothetical protein
MAEESSPGQRLHSAEWNRLRQEILSRDGQQCVNCGAQAELEVHHVVPLYRGGTNKRTNLVTVCRGCHADSHEEDVHDPNEETENERWLPTVEEVSRLVRTTQHPLKRAVLGLFAKTGIGVGELCNLCMADIFLNDSDVSEAYDTREFEWVKNGHPALRIRVEGDEPYSPRKERVETTLVPLDEPMCRALKRWLAVRPDTRRRSRPLFVSTHSWGERLSPLAVHNSVESRAAALRFTDEESELDNFTPYTLRYFFTERFSGQPSVREYILKGTLTTFSFKQLVAHYRNNIYSVF